MRYLDLAVAVMIGTSAISGVVALTPGPDDAASTALALQAHIRDELLGYLQSRGTSWLLAASPSVFCADLGKLSDSTVTFGGSIGGVPCGPSPPTGAVAANLTLDLIPRRVILEGWSAAP